MRPLERRLRELESVPHPNADDYARLLTLASDMEDEIDRLREDAEYWKSIDDEKLTAYDRKDADE